MWTTKLNTYIGDTMCKIAILLEREMTSHEPPLAPDAFTRLREDDSTM